MKTEVLTPTDWREPLEAYLEWMRGIRRSSGTIYQHSYHLRRFAADTTRPPWPVTVDELVAYLASHDHLGASALRLKRQVFRGFYSWGVIVGRWDSNPATQIPSIRASTSVPRPAPEHSVKVGLKAREQRVRLMVMLAAQAGLRCCEICQVRSSDVVDDLVGSSLVARGKGDKQRLVPIPDTLAIEVRRHDGYLFPGQIDGHLSAARVSELISEALPPGVTAHQLRHRYDTRAFAHGGRDIRAVQQLLGHAYVTTTQLYVAVDDDAVRRAALAAAAL